MKIYTAGFYWRRALDNPIINTLVKSSVSWAHPLGAIPTGWLPFPKMRQLLRWTGALVLPHLGSTELRKIAGVRWGFGCKPAADPWGPRPAKKHS